MRSPSRLRRPSSRAIAWGAAAVTAVALYALPALVTTALVTPTPARIAGLLVDVALLVAVAVRRWSPLAVLAAAILGALGAAAFIAATAVGETCGTSGLAKGVETAGGLALAIPLGAWGVRRGAHALWALPAGWLAAAGWVIAWAHVIPGGSGGCFE